MNPLAPEFIPSSEFKDTSITKTQENDIQHINTSNYYSIRAIQFDRPVEPYISNFNIDNHFSFNTNMLKAMNWNQLPKSNKVAMVK